jgi:hypothetical protein
VVFWRGDCLAVGGYRKEFESAEDYDLWTRFSTRGKLANMPDRLMRYRVHSKSVTARFGRRGFALASRAAGPYARTICPDVPAHHFELLNLMLRLEKIPPREEIPGLVDSFERLVSKFRADGLDPETEEQERLWRARLGSQCMVFARQTRFRGGQSLEWMRTARRFQPEIGWRRRLFEILPSRRGVAARLRNLSSRRVAGRTEDSSSG